MDVTTATSDKGADERLIPKMPGPLGYSAALENFGTSAAPLLAGFTFTLIALIITNSSALAEPNLALVLMVPAALSLIAAVQFVFQARQYYIPPEDYLSLLEIAQNDGISKEDIRKSYASWLPMHVRWLDRARVAYNGGILLLLGGVTVALIPPGKLADISLMRAGAAVIVFSGAIVEAIFTVRPAVAALTVRNAQPASSSDRDQLYAVNTWRYLRLAIVLLVAGLAVAIAVELSKVDCLQPSISAYYYTPVRNYFVGAVVGIAVCLVCLRGNERLEDVLLNLAGMLAPVVALVPTPKPGSCSSVPADLTQDQAPNVANNVWPLLAVGLISIIVAIVLTKKHGRSVVARAGCAIAFVLWLAATATFALKRDAFADGAHYAAAIPMFICIGMVVVSNALGYEDKRKLRNRYGAVAAAMVVAAVGSGIAALAHWPYWLIALETALLVLFGVFWLTQTHELWTAGMRGGQGPDRVGPLEQGVAELFRKRLGNRADSAE